MSARTVLRPGATALAAVAALSLLAACGSDTRSGQTGAVVKGLFDRFTGGGDAPAGPPSPEAVAKAIAAADGPLALGIRTDNGAWSYLLKIEQNGPFETYATPSRQTVTMRSGIVTSTRGLGNDLMSSDIEPSIALIRGRRSGSAVRVMRFLDGENHTYTLRFTCTITAGGSSDVQTGTISARVQDVTEECSSGGRTINNIYKVDRTGMVLASSQWLGPLSGDFSISQLKR